jgi:hypothetical protein
MNENKMQKISTLMLFRNIFEKKPMFALKLRKPVTLELMEFIVAVWD